MVGLLESLVTEYTLKISVRFTIVAIKSFCRVFPVAFRALDLRFTEAVEVREEFLDVILFVDLRVYPTPEDFDGMWYRYRMDSLQMLSEADISNEVVAERASVEILVFDEWVNDVGIFGELFVDGP